MLSTAEGGGGRLLYRRAALSPLSLLIFLLVFHPCSTYTHALMTVLLLGMRVVREVVARFRATGGT